MDCFIVKKKQPTTSVHEQRWIGVEESGTLELNPATVVKYSFSDHSRRILILLTINECYYDLKEQPGYTTYYHKSLSETYTSTILARTL
jgi:hypothetical protein